MEIYDVKTRRLRRGRRPTNTAKFKPTKLVFTKQPSAPITTMKQVARRVAKTEIHRQKENKEAQISSLGSQLYYPAQGALYDSNNTIQLSPGSTSAVQIAQGTGYSQRIGNSISIRKATFKAVFVPRPYSAGTNPNPVPTVVKLVLFYNRGDNATTPVPRTDFFQFGNSSIDIKGELADIVSPFNTDKYRILATKTFKLGAAFYSGTTADIPTNDAWQNYANNDFKLNQIVNWNITKYLVKNVRYNDNNLDPVTRGLWMQIMVAPATGDLGLTGVIPANFQYWVAIDYEDA